LESSSKLGTHFTILTIVAAISTLISVAYSIRVIRYLVLGSQKPESRGIKLPLDMKLSLILIIILMIIFWAFPNIITSLTTS
jgi:NADH:ubiquinone oxidoreductase subunit 2 (subunit N)